MDIKRSSSCADDFDPQSLPLETALGKILSSVEVINDTEILGLSEALNHISASDIPAKINVPSHPNSAMDGYAVKFSDLQQSPVMLEVRGKSLAGHPCKDVLEAGQCIRIMTGGVMPSGSDTVVIQEHAERQGDVVKIGSGHKLGQNVRYAGEDIQQGDTVVTTGTRLTPSLLGLLASVGIVKIPCLRPLKVCIFSTGDELKPVGSPLQAGELYDSNRYTLRGMLHRLHADVTDLGVIPDDQDSLKEAFVKASKGYDAIITSGGVSVGEADFTKKVFEQIGDIDFWKIAVKPGRPVAFGKLGDGIYFGLPGNPVSVIVTFYMLVQPALHKMLSVQNADPMMLRAQCTTALRKRPGRVEIQRGVMKLSADGEITVSSTGPQGSGILSSVAQANCFIYLSTDTQSVEVGEYIQIIPFAGLV